MRIINGALAALAFLCTSVVAQVPAALGSQPVAVRINPQTFDNYAGYYQLGPKLVVRLWRENDHYFFGTVGTPQRHEIFPESATQFFLKNVPVILRFAPGPDGKITGMTVKQPGREIEAPRIEQAAAEKIAAAPKGHPMARNWPVMNAVSKPLTAQTVGSMDYWPCFSPDGKTIVFSRTLDGGKTWALMRVPSSGGAATPFIKLAGSVTRADWSAKTGRIVFNLDTADHNHVIWHAIWVANGDGSDAHALATPGLSFPFYPSWYADGKSIAFDDAGRNILYRMTQGSPPVAITNQKQVLAGMSSVSPDGKWIAFAGQKNNGQVYNQEENQIWLVDDHGAVRMLEAPTLPGRTPSWSLDGRRIAFESDRGSPSGQYAVFIINRDGTGLVQVTGYALNASHPVFSPDGHRLVFAMGDPTRKVSSIAIVELP